ncbi:putative thioesterase family protein [Bradyrhizobium sp. ORS 285]|uniref:thioesterase II family protein n=1 Tax=Bradyrhizobium sp. ORS 285 TaxID=115808 RepID=UPI0002406D1D|nr:alpha/beta fold hydrolase [Bradyrhizobium sp. ORS 285]CCD86085.1 putative thioesterase family protein [Bradyrhizobium sp. ORS 285]SMX56123.1 putative thioesterase family protein [Bradyrhizobium sp. ORS 285]
MSAETLLYCMPYAGGSGRVFSAWQRFFHPDIKIVSVDYPGRGTRMREPLLDSIARIADEFAETMASRRHARYALFGHSMGSLVAFEVCHRLALRHGSRPALLAVSGHRAPDAPRQTPAMHDTSDAVFIAHLRELGATPPEVIAENDLMDLLLPILRADFRACETYAPAPGRMLSIPIAAYGGLNDAEVDAAELRAWRKETTGPCVNRLFPGDHFYLRDHAATLAAALQHDLRAALAATPDLATSHAAGS